MQPILPGNNTNRLTGSVLRLVNHPVLRAALEGLEKSRFVAGALILGLAVLLFFAVAGLGSRLPAFPSGKYPIIGSIVDAPLEQIDALQNVSSWPRLDAKQNTSNPFFTMHFQPPPPPPPPKPATSRKVDLTYQGFFETPVGGRHAFVKVGDGLVVGPAGTKVVADLMVKEMNLRTLTMTNQSAQTNLLEFNQKKTIEVPMP